MNTTTEILAFQNAVLDTPLDAIAVKKKGFRIDGPMTDCGLLVSPHVGRGPAATAMLDQAIRAHKGEVIVRGHGWMEGEFFVWTGTSDEFREIWRID